jgi:peptide-methionine (S)-S-oxide reductase
MGGFTPNPTYDETCTGRTGHTETVLVAYDPALTRADDLLKVFWENHDPTTANRQGNDVGTQYRSALYFTTLKQRTAVELTSRAFSAELARLGLPPVRRGLPPAVPAQEPRRVRLPHPHRGGVSAAGAPVTRD